jgi:bifunctional non-homologous end joining protein LigD
VRPELVGEVAFAEWTGDGIVRHPSFQGLREDKDPHTVRREMLKTDAGVNRKDAARSTMPVRLTNPDRVLWPEDGITKAELASYYASIADWVLPHVAARPLTLMRCPRGYGAQCFYQRHMPDGAPAGVRGVPLEEKGERRLYLAVESLEGLLGLVQLDALEFHVWGSRIDRLDYPDRLVLDLDPDPSVSWSKVVDTAKALRELLDELGLVSFVRTTGGKGLHVVVPIERRTTWDEAKSFARDLAAAVARREPALYVLTATKAKRKGKIYLDYLRNARTASAIASYSSRARSGAPVATPLRWDELGARLDPSRFTVRTVPGRLAELGADPWEGFFEVRQVLTKTLREKLRRRAAG